MSVTVVGLIGIVAMVVLLIVGVPIALAMAVTGAVGIWVLEGPGPAMAHTLLVPWAEGRSFVLVTIPLVFRPVPALAPGTTVRSSPSGTACSCTRRATPSATP